jgi:hypothetical protein
MEKVGTSFPFSKGYPMRTVRLLLPGIALLAATLGCSAINYTAGVCDCNPPPVQSVLVPPVRPGAFADIQTPAPPHAPRAGHPHIGPGAPVNGAPMKLPPPANGIPANGIPSSNTTPSGNTTSADAFPDTVPSLEKVPPMQKAR